MLDSGHIFPAFIDLLADDNFSVRLAAMVTLEEMVDANIVIAQAVIDPLWKRYHQTNDSVKGDIVYIFGEVKSPTTLPYLQSVVESESNPEIIEAAKEAFEKIEQS
jgi:HEAT repeat protein